MRFKLTDVLQFAHWWAALIAAKTDACTFVSVEGQHVRIVLSEDGGGELGPNGVFGRVDIYETGQLVFTPEDTPAFRRFCASADVEVFDA